MVGYRLNLLFLLFMIGFTGTAKVHAQVNDTIPNVLNMPNALDRTAVYFYDKLNDKRRTKKELEMSAQSYVNTQLNLDKVLMDELDIQYIDQKDFDAFTLHNILFQTQNGVYVPAHLYVPKGKGPFPAVLNSHGHWPNGKSGDIVQRTAQLLARNGYVCLNIDAWGSGERGTNHIHEYHGASLGSSLLDLGVPLMGMQILDNKRAIDVLQSLPYVNASYIGATGASGGGNQTFWISTLDDRIKAAVPVVSIGTFSSYILNSNCVCELLPNGLVHLETKDLISSVAPKPIKILSALRDGNTAFNVHEMLKTFHTAKDTYRDHEENFCYEIFDEKHDYTVDMRISMLQWFDKHFHQERTEIDTGFKKIKQEDLQVLKSRALKNSVVTISNYVNKQAFVVKDKLLKSTSINIIQKKEELAMLVNVIPDQVESVHYLPTENAYERIVISTGQGKLIPIVVKKGNASKKVLRVWFCSKGNSGIAIKELEQGLQVGQSVVMVDLFGLGERSSTHADKIDGHLPRFHTLSRSAHWLGQSLLSVWVSEIETAVQYLRQEFPTYSLEIVADRETALAALMHSVLFSSTAAYELANLPYSYVPNSNDTPKENTSESINMSIHTQGIISWGDVQLLLALAPDKARVCTLIDLSGNEIDRDKQVTYADEIQQLKIILHN